MDYPNNLLTEILLDEYEEKKYKEYEEGLEKALAILKERDRDILLERYKLHMSYGAIASKYNVSTERIRQIILKQVRLLKGLKNTIANNQIKTDSPLEDLCMSVHANNCLRRAGLRTIGDIIDNKNKLMKIRNFGKGTYEEVRNALNEKINYALPELDL